EKVRKNNLGQKNLSSFKLKKGIKIYLSLHTFEFAHDNKRSYGTIYLESSRYLISSFSFSINVSSKFNVNAVLYAPISNYFVYFSTNLHFILIESSSLSLFALLVLFELHDV